MLQALFIGRVAVDDVVASLTEVPADQLELPGAVGLGDQPKVRVGRLE